MIERLELRNFTGFDELALDFSPKLNVIIGENGTGKTHVLKAAYGLCSGAAELGANEKPKKAEISNAFTHKLLRLFMPLEETLGKLQREGAQHQAKLSVRFASGNTFSASFSRRSRTLVLDDWRNYGEYDKRSVFIPTKEVLSLVKGLSEQGHDKKTIESIFDAGYIDLASALMREPNGAEEDRVNENPRVNTIIPELVDLIGGRYERHGGHFVFQPGAYREQATPGRSRSKAGSMYQDSTITRFGATSGERYSSGMTAEGFRKIGILHLLLSNASVEPGSSGPLFWDEPESNLNPKLMKSLVKALLEISRNGQQVVLATHDYVLLKWIDLLADKGQGDHVSFHILSKQDERIESATTEDYQGISDNAIAETFGALYDAEIQRSLGSRS